MARIARVVAPGIPHHITQRGNRRQLTFFQESDYQLYLDLTLEWSGKHGVQIWAYCLMPNHVHLIAVPEREESLALAISEIHRRYTRNPKGDRLLFTKVACPLLFFELKKLEKLGTLPLF